MERQKLSLNSLNFGNVSSFVADNITLMSVSESKTGKDYFFAAYVATIKKKIAIDKEFVIVFQCPFLC